MDGLPRKDIPPRLANALLPGNVPPSCRRQRLQVGRTNRLNHEHAIIADATAVLLSQASVQQRASSSLGVRRGGTPSLLGSSAVGLSDVTADSVSRVAARSLTPILPPRSSSPTFSQQHGDAVMATVHLQRTAQERRTPVEFAEPGEGHGPANAVAESMTLSAPRRSGATVPGTLRKQLVEGDAVMCAAANRSSVRRSVAVSPTDGSAQRAGIRKFLRAGSADRKTGPAVDPLQAPYIVQPRMRQDIVDYHSTNAITQCPPASGQYASPDARFNAQTRGALGSAALAAEDKAKREHIHHLHVSRRRERESRIGDIARDEESKSLRRDVANIKKRATLRQASMAAAAEVDNTISRRRILTGSPSIPAFLPEF